MNIKDLNEYDPSLYKCYAVTNFKENFTINTVHPSGMQEYTECDIYDIGSRYLVAFKSFNPIKTDVLYKLIYENGKQNIEWIPFEHIVDIINGSYDKSLNTFVINDSVSMPDFMASQEYRVSLDSDRRCDLELYGPMPFYDGISIPGEPLADHTHITADNFKYVNSIFSSIGNIHITRNIHNRPIPDEAFKYYQACTGMSRGINSILKLLAEWSDASESPINSTERIAIQSKAAVIDFDFSDDVIEEIKNLNHDMPVKLFIDGDENPRRVIDENIVVTPKLKNWILKRIRYMTLSSLIENYPEDVSILEELKHKEDEYLYSSIYEYCLINNMDMAEINESTVLMHASHIENIDTLTNQVLKNLKRIIPLHNQ
jgi:hypothetical protein